MSDFINRPNLEDCSINTLIKYVPNIINNNNQEIKRVLSDIFEFGVDTNTAQYIKTPINTKGIVKGNSGQFYNLYTSHITLDSSALNEDLLNAKVYHQNSPDRFKVKINEDIFKRYAHDSDSIVYDFVLDSSKNTTKSVSVKEFLQDTEIKIKDISTNVNTNNTTLKLLDASIKEVYSILNDIVSKLNIEKEATAENNENNNLVEAYNNPTKSYTYSSQNYK